MFNIGTVHQEYLKGLYRKPIEMTFSSLTRLVPRRIHAGPAKGFELKVVLFLLACAFTHLVSYIGVEGMSCATLCQGILSEIPTFL